MSWRTQIRGFQVISETEPTVVSKDKEYLIFAGGDFCHLRTQVGEKVRFVQPGDPSYLELDPEHLPPGVTIITEQDGQTIYVDKDKKIVRTPDGKAIDITGGNIGAIGNNVTVVQHFD